MLLYLDFESLFIDRFLAVRKTSFRRTPWFMEIVRSSSGGSWCVDDYGQRNLKIRFGRASLPIITRGSITMFSVHAKH